MLEYIILSFLLLPVLAIGQQKLTEFPGTGFGIQLPDTGYKFEKDRAFYSQSTKSSFMLLNQEEDFSNMDYGLFMKMMMKDFEGPGITILVDQLKADSSRLVKARINTDSTDSKPSGNGKKNIVWLYFQKYNNRPVLVMASYPYKSDGKLNGPTSKSLLSFKRIDQKQMGLFKNNFSFTNDYAPLKYCGRSFGGIRLNMEGTYEVKGPDKSYCLIIPINMKLPELENDDLRTYLLTRLQVHVNGDIGADTWSWGYQDGKLVYSMTGIAKDDRIMFLAILPDDKGYFEVWGETKDKNLVEVFKSIALSVKRD